MYFLYGEKEINHLRSRDKKFAEAIDRIGTIKRAVNPDLFSALIESIIGQQISNKAAATVCYRLSNRYAINAQVLDELTVEEIQACGMSMRKAGYIKDIANAVVDGVVNLDNLKDKPDDEVIKILTNLRGVGTWTAEMLLIFSLMRPNVISYDDLAIRRGMMNLYGHKELPKERFLRYAKRYSPYCSVASLYLWELSHLNS